MIIDIHGHLGNINFAPFWQADAPALEDYCRKSGVDYLCVSASRAIMYDVREGNRELDAALKKNGETAGLRGLQPRLPRVGGGSGLSQNQ